MDSQKIQAGREMVEEGRDLIAAGLALIDEGLIETPPPPPPPPPDPKPEPEPEPPPPGVEATITASLSADVVDEGSTVTLTYSFENVSKAELHTNRGPIQLDKSGGSVGIGPLRYTQSVKVEFTDLWGRKAIEPLNIVVRRPSLPALDPLAPPTIASVQSGTWSDPATWGGRLPNENDIALIPDGHVVDAMGRIPGSAGRILVDGSLRVLDGVLYATDVHIRPSGVLALNPLDGEKALVILQNRPKHPNDTADRWRGVVCEGTFSSRGRKPTVRARCVTAPKAGDTFVDLDRDVVDWRAGDKLLLPSTYPVESSSRKLPEWADEVVVVRRVDGRRVHFLHPLKYDHPGRMDPLTNWAVQEEGPPIAHLMRDCGFITTDPTDTATRGHVEFAAGATVDAESCMFHGTGRSGTKDNYYAPGGHRVQLDVGRHPVILRKCDYSRLDHCVSLDTFPLVSLSSVAWGIAAVDCPGVCITNCVSFDWYGAGIFVEHRDHTKCSGEIRDNVVCRVIGNKGRGDQNDGGFLGKSGTGVWHRTPVAHTGNWYFDTSFYGIESVGYGEKVSAPPSEWRDNEVCGTTFGFVQFGVSASYPRSHPNPERGEFGRLVVWNFSTRALSAYPCKNVDIRDWVVRGIPPAWRIANLLGLYFHDYWWEGGDVIDCDVRGCLYGVLAPVITGDAGVDPAIRRFRVVGGIYANDFEFDVESAFSTSNVSVRPTRDITFAPASLPVYKPRKAQGEVRCKIGGPDRPFRAPHAPTIVTYVRPADGKTYRVYCAEQASDCQVWGECAPQDAAQAPWAVGLVKAQETEA